MCLRLFWAVERNENVVNSKHKYDDVVIVVDCGCVLLDEVM